MSIVRRAGVLAAVLLLLACSAGCKKKPKKPGLPATVTTSVEDVSEEEASEDLAEDDEDDEVSPWREPLTPGALAHPSREPSR